MSFDGLSPAPGRILVLGGIRSGKSSFAESLAPSDGSVRYVATGVAGDDPGFTERIDAHRRRRSAAWQTIEAGGHPRQLVGVLRAAEAGQTLLVDDLGNWAATALLDPDGRQASAAIEELAEAIRACRANVVLVSPEVGLSVVPATELGARFADQLGLLNQAVAQACDAVVLVVAGQPAWLREQPPQSGSPATVAPPMAGQVLAETQAASENTAPQEVPIAVIAPEQPVRRELPTTVAAPESGVDVEIGPGMALPIPDDQARDESTRHLALLDLPGAGLGALARTVKFAAGTQGTAVPQPWRRPRLVLLHGDHDGDVAAGESPAVAASVADEARRGEGPIGLLAAEHGVGVQVVPTAAAGPIEFAEALDDNAVESALRLGWRIADDAADSGVDLLILGSCGAGAQGAAAAVVSIMTGAELPALLARVVAADGSIDDEAWMRRCVAARDAKHRVRERGLAPRQLLKELGGADMAIAAGVILGATSRRTPVLLDGPLGVAAGLIARDLGSQSRHWCALADHGQHPTTRTGADVLGLVPLLDLAADLGEGATALLALPLLRSALALAGSLPTRPPVLPAPPEYVSDTPAADLG